MIRKFNYTNRKKIAGESVDISVQTINGVTSFIATIHKDELKFPPDAKVYIEPYYGFSYLRFDFGTFDSIKQPANTDITDLKKISDKVYFRIKIVDESHENGLLLGFGDKLPLADDGEPEGKSSLLFVNAVPMDTNEIWRLNFTFDPDGMPILEVNSSIDGIRDIAKSDPRFIALVYPTAIRQILERIEHFERDGESWTARWIRFTEDIMGISPTPDDLDDEEKIDDWIGRVVRIFCIKYKTLENFVKTIPS